MFILFFFEFNKGFSQSEFEVPYHRLVEFDQEYGLHIEKGDFLMKVAFDEDTLWWQSDKTLLMDASPILQQSDKYVMVQSSDGTYVFFDIREKRLFYLIQWESSHTAFGMGTGSFALQEIVDHMIYRLLNGQSKYDVMSFLIEQSSYEF